jgi:hypothetical protein
MENELENNNGADNAVVTQETLQDMVNNPYIYRADTGLSEEKEQTEEESTQNAALEEEKPNLEDKEVDHQKELKRALKKLNRVKAENRELVSKIQKYDEVARSLYEKEKMSAEAATVFYGSNIDLSIDKVKKALEKAYMDDDVEAKVNLTAELSELSAQKARNEQYKAMVKSQEEHRKQNNEVQKQNVRQQYEPEVEEWIEKNPWFDQNSQDFDAEMHDTVQHFAQTLEHQYVLKGKQHKIGSEDYFKEIDDFVKERFFEEELQPKQEPKNEKKAVFSKVAPVRPNLSVGAAGKGKIVLTERQKNIAQNLGISEERFIKRLLENQKTQSNVR